MAYYTLQQMECFFTIVECGSMSRAAEQMFVTQPSLSKTLRRLEDGRAETLDWGIVLSVPLEKNTCALGIRMHSILPGEGENAFRCRVEEVIENPFSFTVMLRPLEAKEGSVPIGWEMEKQVWERLKTGELTVRLPVEGLLQLRG